MVAALSELAEQMGVLVLEHQDGPKGLWLPARRAVTLRADLGPVQRRCTLAHELGHANYDDLSPAPDRWVWARQEQRADEWAANLLISCEDYEHAENTLGPHAGAIAQELGVTTHFVRVWRGTYERTPSP